MADAFGEDDIFAVFEDDSGPNSNKKSKKDKRETAGPSTSTDVSHIGEKRDFTPDVIDLALEDSGAKKAKLDDLERWIFKCEVKGLVRSDTVLRRTYITQSRHS